MASLITPRGMALLFLVTVLVFAVLIGQTNGDIDVASSFTGATDLIKDAADQIEDKASDVFAGGNVEVNKEDEDAATPASSANVNSAGAGAAAGGGTNEGFEEEEGTLGGDWRVIGH